jgi:hypothetical protein
MKVRNSDILAWVRGQMKMSQVLGVFRLLDSPSYGPFSLGTRFETYQPFISLTLCRSNLNPYCLGRKAGFFSVGI